MASTFTPLGVELQATGENAGTWGTKTNTNLQIIEQISGGYISKSIAGGAQTTALAVSDGSTGADTIIGGAGIDALSGDTGADVFSYTASSQGAAAINVTTAAAGNASAAGDTITDFAAGTGNDDLNFADASFNGSVAAATKGASGSWNMNTHAVYAVTAKDMAFTGGTTQADVVAGKIGAVTGDVGDIGYALLTDDANSIGKYELFQIELKNARTAAAVAGTDEIAHIATITSTADIDTMLQSITFVG